MEHSVKPNDEPQSAAAVLMVRPASFAFNPETASTNAFQEVPAIAADTGAQGLALKEFDAVAAMLSRSGVDVIVAEDTPSPVKPDAIFPNNWVSFHRDGCAVLYPMLAPNRRLERRDELLREVGRCGYRIDRIVDLSPYELGGQFLEGTGSLVLDRVNRIAYASLSSRTDADVLTVFAEALRYEPVVFQALDSKSTPVYHTNVAMAVGAQFAVVCGEVIADRGRRTALFESLRATGHDVLDISPRQMARFAGNLLELAPASGNAVVLSQSAWGSLTATQRRFLERRGDMLIVEVPVIERWGGGGVRCMLTEIHLPKAG